MDLTTVVLPGAQSLVTAMLTDSWHQMRTALSRLWARRRPEQDGSAEPETAELEQARTELDLAMQQALAVAGEGSEAERAGRMELFWAGYLAGRLAARGDLADAIRALPTLLGTRRDAAGAPVTENDFSGRARNVVQGGDISGGISFRG